MTLSTKVLTERHENIWLVKINRPECRNAIDKETAIALHSAFKEYDEDASLSIAILSAVGDTFCAGADLKAISTGSTNAPELKKEGLAPLGVSRMRLGKPVIAAVEGFAVAGGLEIALWCDLRIAAEDAVFGVYCRRFGVPLVDGGTTRLPRLIGQSRAMDMILTGRGVSGAEAVTMGLVNRLTEKGNALNASFELARKLANLPQMCMRSDRLSAYEQWDLSESDALKNETIRGLQVIASGESKSGASTFIRGDYSVNKTKNEPSNQRNQALA